MASRRVDTKKPESDREHVKKNRKCLMCHNEFMSGHIGGRVCPSCKETTVWRSGGIAA